MKIRITSRNTFGVKKLSLICNNEKLFLVNLFGFGFWIHR